MPATQVLSRPALAEYYGRPAVRARIREYCGFDSGHSATSVFLSAALPGAPIPNRWTLHPRFPTRDLDELLDRGADIFRSLWDRDSLLVCFDVDCLNADRLGHPFARPAEVFRKLEPTYQAVCGLLVQHGLSLLPVMTGRGYQFIGRVPLESAIVHHVAALAPGVPDWHAMRDRRLPRWIDDRMSSLQARAYVGTGLLLEHLAHQVMRRAAGASPIPLVLNGTNVGAGGEGREAVSLDLSFAGDPLDVRHVRVTFGGYQLHRFRPDLYGPDVAALEPLVAVPRGSRTLDEMLHGYRSPAGAGLLAESSDARIPDVTEGLTALAADYEPSSLARFHRDFHAIEPHGPAAWASTYDRLDLPALPPCVAAPLAAPHDLLLRPEHLQHVTRHLMSDGWAPRHIAGLVWSRYGKDFGWGDRWMRLSPRARAEFDVRVFAGMVATGLDRGVDFNCRSAQEKRLCPLTGCPRDLRVNRDRLLARWA
ncbi:MAG: hypothetical protein HYY76_05005 [Acidobacteria bacterium]|nr:hypothetical protein [Acidobacteriota bacterium]